jgi:hypothetical protein
MSLPIFRDEDKRLSAHFHTLWPLLISLSYCYLVYGIAQIR